MPKYTKAQVERSFRETILPCVRERFEQDGAADYPARSEAWNNFTDALCKDGAITSHQYNTWSHPACCISPHERRREQERRKRARDKERAANHPRSYIATVRAASGFLVGAVKVHRSSRFASRRDAFSFAWTIRDLNRMAKRDVDPNIDIEASHREPEIHAMHPDERPHESAEFRDAVARFEATGETSDEPARAKYAPGEPI